MNLFFTKLVVNPKMIYEVLFFEFLYLVSNFGFSKLFGLKIYEHLEWTELKSLGSIAVFTIFVVFIFFLLVKGTQHRLSEQK